MDNLPEWATREQAINYIIKYYGRSRDQAEALLERFKREHPECWVSEDEIMQ